MFVMLNIRLADAAEGSVRVGHSMILLALALLVLFTTATRARCIWFDLLRLGPILSADFYGSLNMFQI